MTHETALLRDFTPMSEYLVAVDSDGCVFDNMEIKHKECFCPALIFHFELQAASKYVREIWEFVNLYGSTRGINRFKGLQLTLDYARRRPEIITRGVNIPEMPDLASWIESERCLGDSTLEFAVERTGSLELRKVLDWSQEVSRTIARVVHGVGPFPGVREVIASAGTRADAIVVSQAPREILAREWSAYDLDQLVRCIAGQDDGTKQEHLATAVGTNEKRYQPDRILVIGDAPGDHAAAESVGALFFPIIPGDEEHSWKTLRKEGLEQFFNGTYRGEYAIGLTERFYAALPETPPWEER